MVDIGIVSLSACSGCQVALLDHKEILAKILPEIRYATTIFDEREVPELDICLVEGAVRTREDLEKLREARSKSRILVGLGSCATYGGIPAAKGSVTGNMGAQFLQTANGGILGSKYVSKAGLPVVNLPCCPVHPDWVTLTLASIIIGKGGLIELDRYNRPTVFFPPDHTIHEN